MGNKSGKDADPGDNDQIINFQDASQNAFEAGVISL